MLGTYDIKSTDDVMKDRKRDQGHDTKHNIFILYPSLVCPDIKKWHSWGPA